MRRALLLIAVLAAGLFAQQKPAPDSSELNGNTFRSLYFHFTYQYPAGWAVQTSAEKKQVMDRGRDEMEKKGAGGEGMEESIKRTYSLFMAFRYPQGQQPEGTLNPAVALVVENLGQADVADGRAYLNAMAPTMEKAGFKPQGEIRAAQYDGHQFYEYRVALPSAVEAHQIYSCTVLRAWAMCFIFSAGSSKEADELALSARTLKFEAQ